MGFGYDKTDKIVQEPPREIERLKLECAACRRCNGSGFVSVFHPRHNSTGFMVLDDSGRRYATKVAAHCDCALGTLIHRSASPEVVQRTPWVSDIVRGRSVWQLADPTEDADPELAAMYDELAALGMSDGQIFQHWVKALTHKFSVVFSGATK